MDTLKILGVANAAWPSLGGIETFLTGLGAYLAQRADVEYRLISSNPYDGENLNPHPTLWAPDRDTVRDWIAWCDVVHTHVMDFGVLREARRLGKRIVNTNHDVTMICPKGDKMRWDGACVNRAGPIVCARCLHKTGSPLRHLVRPPAKAALSWLTDAQVVTSAWAARRYPLAHKHIIPYGIDPQQFPPKSDYALAGERPSVAFMGRLVKEKGVQTLIEAAALAKSQGRPFVARVYGDGAYRAALVEHAQRFNIEDCIDFAGRLDGDAKATALRNADIGVVPSLWEEAFGISALEMMAVGLPVVASATGGLEDLVAPIGVLVERGDVKALASALIALGADEPRRRALGQTASLEAQRRYSLDHCHQRYLDLYRACFDRAAGDSRN